jgi:flagellar assembly factor FliW
MSVSAAPRASTVAATVPITETIIVFPNGLVGQPDWKRFILTSPEADATVQLLQSVDNAELALMVTNPVQIIENYTVSLTNEERSALKLKPNEQPTLLCTVSIHNNLITTNLVGPLVFNRRNRIGAQVVMIDSPYSTRHPVAQLGSQE